MTANSLVPYAVEKPVYGVNFDNPDIFRLNSKHEKSPQIFDLQAFKWDVDDRGFEPLTSTVSM